MSKQLSIERRVRNLKHGKPFIVATAKERLAAGRAAVILYRAGVIDFKIDTRKEGNGFKVAAI